MNEIAQPTPPRGRPGGRLWLALSALTASMLLLGASPALAVTYTFTQLNSEATDPVSQQLSVDVIDNGDNTVTFTFYNYAGLTATTSQTLVLAAAKPVTSEDSKTSSSGDGSSGSSSDSKTSGSSDGSSGSSSDSKSGSSSDSTSTSSGEDGSGTSGESGSGSSGEGTSTKGTLTDIYVTGTDGLLVLPGTITAQSPGVSFSIGASPPNLPVGPVYDFYATAGADSNAPVMKNGVSGAGEYVSWTFALQSGASYQDVTNALNAGTLRIGALVPGTSGGSSSFINSCGMGASCSQTPTVPLPASLWLMVGALGSLGWVARRGRLAMSAV